WDGQVSLLLVPDQANGWSPSTGTKLSHSLPRRPGWCPSPNRREDQSWLTLSCCPSLPPWCCDRACGNSERVPCSGSRCGPAENWSHPESHRHRLSLPTSH